MLKRFVLAIALVGLFACSAFAGLKIDTERVYGYEIISFNSPLGKVQVHLPIVEEDGYDLSVPQAELWYDKHWFAREGGELLEITSSDDGKIFMSRLTSTSGDHFGFEAIVDTVQRQVTVIYLRGREIVKPRFIGVEYTPTSVEMTGMY